jgi:hypothetical protein
MSRRDAAAVALLLALLPATAACGGGEGGAGKRVVFADEGDTCKDSLVLYLDEESGDQLLCEEARYRGPLTGAQRNAVSELAHQLAVDGSLSGADRSRISAFAADPSTVERQVQPDAVAVGEGAVWVLGDDALVRVDPQAGTASLQPVELTDATELVVGEGALWVLASGAVVKVDPATGEQVGTVTVFEDIGLGEPRTTGLAVGAGAVWLAWHVAEGPAMVTRLDAATLRQTAQVELSDRGDDVSRQLLLAGGALWTAPSGSPYLGKLDPLRLRVTSSAGFSEVVTGHATVGPLAASRDALWVLVGPVGTGLVRIDLQTAAVSLALGGAGLPQKNGYAQYAKGVAVVGSTPWLATSDVVVAVDPVAHRLTRTIEVGTSAVTAIEGVSTLASGYGDLWALGSHEVLRVDLDSERVTEIEMPTQDVPVR